MWINPAKVKLPLLPCLSVLLSFATSYAAAVNAGLDDSAKDLAVAEASGNATLRGQVQPIVERSREAKKSEIAMTVARRAFSWADVLFVCSVSSFPALFLKSLGTNSQRTVCC